MRVIEVIRTRTSAIIIRRMRKCDNDYDEDNDNGRSDYDYENSNYTIKANMFTIISKTEFWYP